MDMGSRRSKSLHFFFPLPVPQRFMARTNTREKIKNVLPLSTIRPSSGERKHLPHSLHIQGKLSNPP